MSALSSSAAKEPKLRLQKLLGKLLGFDDGAEDVLEHLFSIQSTEDVSDYLQQLLGLDAASEELKSFVDDIGRYHRGEQLTVDVLDDNIADQMAGNNTKLPAELQQSQQSFSVVTNQNNVKNSNKSRNQIQQKSRVPPPARRRSPSRAAEAALLSSTSAKPSSASSKPSPSPEKVSARDQSPFPASATTAPASTTTTTKSRPQRGQRTNPVCGCFGTKHEPLTNCLLCGRISCAIENYDFCPFCSYLLEEIRMDGSQNLQDKAWIQKERLLRFDREFARRTEIFDDQADYQNPTTWLSDEERQEAEKKQREHLESMKRPKQMLKLDI